MTENKRPVFLDLTKLRFPPMAIVSIGHRISGVFIFLFLPLMIYLLHLALHSENSFRLLSSLLNAGWMKFLLWIMLTSIWYHLVAGIRHLIMDAGYGESLGAARRSAYIVFGITIILSIATGVCLW